MTAENWWETCHNEDGRWSCDVSFLSCHSWVKSIVGYPEKPQAVLLWWYPSPYFQGHKIMTLTMQLKGFSPGHFQWKQSIIWKGKTALGCAPCIHRHTVNSTCHLQDATVLHLSAPWWFAGVKNNLDSLVETYNGIIWVLLCSNFNLWLWLKKKKNTPAKSNLGWKGFT